MLENHACRGSAFLIESSKRRLIDRRRSAKGLAGAHAVAMQALLAGAKEVTRRPTRMVKACLTVIKVGEKLSEASFRVCSLLGTLLSLPLLPPTVLPATTRSVEMMRL